MDDLMGGLLIIAISFLFGVLFTLLYRKFVGIRKAPIALSELIKMEIKSIHTKIDALIKKTS